MNHSYTIIASLKSFPYIITLAYSLRKTLTLSKLILYVPKNHNLTNDLLIFMMRFFDHIVHELEGPTFIINYKSVVVSNIDNIFEFNSGKCNNGYAYFYPNNEGIITSEICNYIKSIKDYDDALFNSYFRKILQKYPDIKNYDVFHEAIRNNLKFDASYLRKFNGLKRSNYVFDINKLYGINAASFNKTNLEFYHTDITKEYSPNHLNLLFEGIKEYDFMAPIKLLKFNYKSSFFDGIYKDINNSKHYSINEFDVNHDFIMTYYVQCRNKCTIIINQSEIDIKDLSAYGNIYYYKKITLTKHGINNLFYVLNTNLTYNARIDLIKSLNLNTDIFIYVLDVIDNHKLNHIKTKFNILMLSETFYQTVLFAQYLFSHTSIKFLEIAELNNNWYEANIKLNTFKKIIYLNMDLKELNNLLLISGSVLQAYGLRSAFDIDAIVIDSKLDNNKLLDFINSNIKDFPFITDVGIMKTSLWRDTWTDKNDQILKSIGINNIYDLVLDPSNYFYYNGIKHANINFEIAKKLQRIFNNISREIPKFLYDIADLILLNNVNLFDRQLTLPLNNENNKITNKLINIIQNIYKANVDSNVINKFVSEKLIFIQ